jgi:hypothetical protein
MKSVSAEEPFKTKRIGALPPEVILQYSGLEVLHRMANGELPHPATSEIPASRIRDGASGF